MVKKVSYTLPPKFQLAFIITAALAYVGTALPYVSLFTQDHAMYASMANTTLLVVNIAVPLVVGLIAVALTHRRGMGRWWIAAGAGFVVAMIEQLLMSLMSFGGMIAPMNYEQLNIIAAVVAAVVTLGAVWCDRLKTPEQLRQWRVAGIALLYASAVIFALIDTLGAAANGQDLASTLLPFGLTLGAIALFVGVTLYVYRRLPLAERVKRALLALTSAILLTMGIGGVVSMMEANQMALVGVDWLGIVTSVVAYVAAAWWLLPPKTNSARRRKVRA